MAADSGFQVGQGAPHYYELHVSSFMTPFVDALVAATVAEGHSVLDVACGTGFASRAALTVAGRAGRVHGCDVNPAMLAQARSISGPAEGGISWREASALDLPYDSSQFDAVICQQGLQFFPDPAAGVREMARVARAGGRVGATVWSPAEQTPFLDRETDMLARYGDGPQAAFSATEEQLVGWFVAGGVEDVSIQRLVVSVDLPPIREFVPEHLKALPWSAVFFDLPVGQQVEAIAELEADLGQYATNDGITVPFSSYVATASL